MILVAVCFNLICGCLIAENLDIFELSGPLFKRSKVQRVGLRRDNSCLAICAFAQNKHKLYIYYCREHKITITFFSTQLMAQRNTI